MKRWLLNILLITSLLGCGQTGRLYLPGPNQPALENTSGTLLSLTPSGSENASL